MKVEMKVLVIITGLLVLAIGSFGTGVLITQYKVFPYTEIKAASIKIKNIVSSNDDSEYGAEPYRVNYPHIRVTHHGVQSADEVSLVVRSDKTPIPMRINLYDPLTGRYAFSLKKSDFHIEHMPLKRCVLINGEECGYYAKYQLKRNDKLKGEYLISFEKSVNEKTLEPTTDFIKLPNEKQCDIAVVYPDYTFLAYNSYGGHSLYSQPFPVAGLMGSSVVAYDRPLMSSNITKTYFPTNTIARSIEEMGIGCISLETNSSLESQKNLNRFKLIVLAGHDEYWTSTLATKLDNYVKSGKSLAVFSGNTNFRRIVLEGNTARRDKHTAEFNPTENIIGLACRFGCLPACWADCLPETKIENANIKNVHFVSDYDLLGMKVLDPLHPVFNNTNLQKNDFFGRDSSLVWYEVDGAPLDHDTETIVYGKAPSVTPIYDGENFLNAPYEALNVKPLASTYLRYFSSDESQVQYAATFVEYKNGKGTVLNGGSVGWFKAIDEKDSVSTTIFQNSITYLLGKNE